MATDEEVIVSFCSKTSSHPLRSRAQSNAEKYEPRINANEEGFCMSLPIAAQCVLLKYGTDRLSFAIVLECARQRGTRRRRFVGISISSLLRSDIKREPPPMSLSLVTKRCRLTGNCRFRCHRTPGRAGHEYARIGRLAVSPPYAKDCSR